MREREKSFWDEYNEILNDADRWCYYRDMYGKITAENLFNDNKAINFIKSVFKHGGKNEVVYFPHCDEFEITTERANHALSAYLFGILLRDGLQIDMRELPKLHKEPTKNFLYFWSLTCLYHDFTFTLEQSSYLDENKNETEKSRKYITELKTIDNFCKFFSIEYSLADKSGDGKLIKNYYNYRIDRCHAVDHGIAAGMLLYDNMMKVYNSAAKSVNAKQDTGFIYNELKFSKEYPRHALLIANTIAKHNMWRANKKNVDIFKDYDLNELIPNEERSHIVSINGNDKKTVKDKLLFLLGLVDTLEPVKCMGRKKNKVRDTDPYTVLKKMKIELNSREKTITIHCPEKYFNDYMHSTMGISEWLDVSPISKFNEKCIQYTINLKNLVAV